MKAVALWAVLVAAGIGLAGCAKPPCQRCDPRPDCPLRACPQPKP